MLFKAFKRCIYFENPKTGEKQTLKLIIEDLLQAVQLEISFNYPFQSLLNKYIQSNITFISLMKAMDGHSLCVLVVIILFFFCTLAKNVLFVLWMITGAEFCIALYSSFCNERVQKENNALPFEMIKDIQITFKSMSLKLHV